MRDRPDHDRMKPDDFPPPHDAGQAALRAALRALPDAAPPSDGWQRLAARAARRRRLRPLRTWVPLAAAASLAAAVLLVRTAMHERPAPTPASTATSATGTSVPDVRIATLQRSSQRMERWLRRLDRDGAPLDGAALADASEIEDQIGLVDLQLGAAADDPSARLRLWRQRVALLQDLAMLRVTRGGGYDGGTTAEADAPTHY